MATRFYLHNATPTSTSNWVATIGGTALEQGGGVAVHTNGDIYTTFQSASQTAGQQDIYLVKYNSTGTLQWQRSIGGATLDVPNGIALDSSGNPHIISRSNSTGTAGADDFYIVKYDTTGALTWQRMIGGISNDDGYGIAVDSSGNVYVTGDIGTVTGGAGSSDTGLIKYNSAGTIQFQVSIGGTGYDSGRGVDFDSSGNVYLGAFEVSTTGNNNFLIVKYNTSGVLQWQRIIGGSFDDVCLGIKIDVNNNIYSFGYSSSATGGVTNDMLIFKHDTSGNLIWQKHISYNPGVNGDVAAGLGVDGLGNIYISGHSTAAPQGGANDLFIIKLNSSGSLIWERTFGGTGQDYTSGNLVYFNGFFYISGIQTSSGLGAVGGAGDALLIKFLDDGSGTGTYGGLVYAVSAVATITTPTYTNTTSTLTTNTRTLTTTTPTLTSVTTRTLPSATYPLGYPSGPNSVGGVPTITLDNILRTTDTTVGTAQVSRTIATLGNTSLQKAYFGSFISLPLDSAQTVGGGAIILNNADAVTNLSANFWINAMNIYVWRPSTYTKIGTIRDNTTTSLGGLEATAISSIQVTHISAITSSAVSALAGDVIIFEIWGSFTQGAATAYSITHYFDGTTVNTTENTVVTSQASFIELTENLTFVIPSTSVDPMGMMGFYGL